MSQLKPVATVSRGLEEVLAQELVELGLPEVEPERGAVSFGGDLDGAYRACLWSRVASRVLWPVGRFPCPHADALYDGVRGVDWQEHLGADQTLAVDFVGRSESLRHTVFGARVTKDAICDQLRDRTGRRPSVDLSRPDLRLSVHLSQDVATVAVDLSGDPLHLRGVGRRPAHAPLRENLAAALLRLADWPALAASGRPFFDPMCGTGTLLTEAAGMAAGRAAGLARSRWGMQGWYGHEPRRWRRLLEEAQAAEGNEVPVQISGADADPSSVALAQDQVRAWSFGPRVRVDQGGVSEARPEGLGEVPGEEGPRGLLLTNPPYGERLGEADALVGLYQELGDVLRHHFLGWDAYVITSNKRLAHALGLRAKRRIPVWNGGLECRLLYLPISSEAPRGARDWVEDR